MRRKIEMRNIKISLCKFEKNEVHEFTYGEFVNPRIVRYVNTSAYKRFVQHLFSDFLRFFCSLQHKINVCSMKLKWTSIFQGRHYVETRGGSCLFFSEDDAIW